MIFKLLVVLQLMQSLLAIDHAFMIRVKPDGSTTKTSTEVLRRSPQWAFNTHTHKQTHTYTDTERKRKGEVN